MEKKRLVSLKVFKLLQSRRFLPLFLTQFLGAFNDNFFKNALVILITFYESEVLGLPPEQMVALSGGIFVLPYILFSALAGQLAEKYDKAIIVRWVKYAEIGIMAIAALGFSQHNTPLLLFALFLLGIHSTFFGPVKYAILPQHLKSTELITGNSLVAAATFIAILIGTLLGGLVMSLHPAPQEWVSALAMVFAIFGAISAIFVPTAPGAHPDLKIQLNPWTLTLKVLKISAKNEGLFNAILGISWFWFFGAAALSVLPSYTKDVLHGEPWLATLFLALFTVGVSCGALMCGPLSKRTVELGLIPVGAFGSSFFVVLVAYFSPNPYETGFQIMSFQGGAICVTFFLLSLCCGLYSVPLITVIQSRSDEKYRSRIIAGGNVINSLFMVGASVFILILFRLHFTIPQIFLYLGVIHFIVAIYIFRQNPEFLYRFFSFILSRWFYKIRVKGLENIPVEGPAILVSNHMSWLDWLIIFGSIDRPVRFVMDNQVLRNKVLWSLLEDAQVIPIASRAVDKTVLEEAFKQIHAELAAGELICLFPEGRITYKPELNRFKPGVARVIKESDVPVIPMAINGMWGSFWSRAPQKRTVWQCLRKPRRRIELVIGTPVPAKEARILRMEAEVNALRNDRLP